MFSSRTLALLVCVVVAALVISCGGQSEPDSTAVAQAVAETLTAMPTVADTATAAIPPTATLVPTATNNPSPTPNATSEPSATPTATEVPPTPTATSAPATATPTETPAPQAAQNGNLRAGPGTDYAVTSSVRAGEQLDLTGQNEAGDWYALTRGNSEAWIAAFLVSDPPSGPLPVKESTAPTVTPTLPPPTPTSPPQQQPGSTPTSSSSSLKQIGEEFEARGWRFKVSDVVKRKAVYFYDNSYVAFGHFLIVIADVVNLQSGTDYPYRNLRPWVTDRPGKIYRYSSTGSSYAEWQLGGLDSAFEDVNPGQSIRFAMAYDIPDDVGDVYLSTEALIWVYLGNFSSMPSED